MTDRMTRAVREAARGLGVMLVTVALLAAGCAAPGAVTPGDGDEPLYAGETIRVIVRSSPGGGYDFYGRLLARHLGKHIPGNPRVIVINMPGAGGIVAANYLSERAARDGTEIAILARELAIGQRLGETGLDYDVRTLIPIGSAAGETSVWAVAADLPIETLEDLKNFPGVVRFSTTGPGASGFQLIRLLEFEGFPVEIISGYDGTAEKILAVLRGEVQGTTGSYESLLPSIRDGDLKVIGRLGSSPPGTDFQDVRPILSADGRTLAEMMSAALVAGRPFFTAPDTPPDRVGILREAFRKALEDPELLAEAERAGQSILWTSAEEMEEIYAGILGASDEVVSRFLELVR